MARSIMGWLFHLGDMPANGRALPPATRTIAARSRIRMPPAARFAPLGCRGAGVQLVRSQWP